MDFDIFRDECTVCEKILKNQGLKRIFLLLLYHFKSNIRKILTENISVTKGEKWICRLYHRIDLSSASWTMKYWPVKIFSYLPNKIIYEYTIFGYIQCI